MAQYRPIDERRHGVDAALLLGVKAPTGETHAKGKAGTRFETEFQPGSGSWDPMAGVALTKHFGRVAVDGNALYRVATEGSRNSDLGDSLSYNLALTYRLIGGERHDHNHVGLAAGEAVVAEHAHLGLDLILELNGEWRAKKTVDGIKDRHSGGNLVFVAPGLRFTAPQGWSAFVSVGVPVVEDLNGIQTDTDYRIVAGGGLAF